MKRVIAIVCGGDSSEKEVSMRSASGIYSFLSETDYECYIVRICKESWEVLFNQKTYPIDRNDFSFNLNGEKVKFDYAYITIHGTPGENGILQGYFELIGIPFSTCRTLASALTFDKFVCNHFLASFGIEIPKAIRLFKHDFFDKKEIIHALGLPIFVKPTDSGSSFGVTRVNEESELKKAITIAFQESSTILLESFVDGVEVTCGCFKDAEGIKSLPLTEVVSKREFFDYDAKYNGAVEEITPARISQALTQQIQKLTEKIYRELDAQGIIRVDYIIRKGSETPVLLEVNTTPGMTQTSFIPQQVAAYGMRMGVFLENIIEHQMNFKYLKSV